MRFFVVLEQKFLFLRCSITRPITGITAMVFNPARGSSSRARPVKLFQCTLALARWLMQVRRDGRRRSRYASPCPVLPPTTPMRCPLPSIVKLRRVARPYTAVLVLSAAFRREDAVPVRRQQHRLGDYLDFGSIGVGRPLGHAVGVQFDVVESLGEMLTMESIAWDGYAHGKSVRYIDAMLNSAV